MNPLRHTLTPLRAWLLAVLLLAAQAAGLAHRVSHPQLPGATAVAQAQALKKAAAAGGQHQAGSTDCRLIDQLMHADVLCTAANVQALLPQPPDSAAALPRAALRAVSAALYLARAPPRA